MADLAIVEPGSGRLGIAEEDRLGIGARFVPDIGPGNDLLVSRPRQQGRRGDEHNGDGYGKTNTFFHGGLLEEYF
jgi:hypothetical protein